MGSAPFNNQILLKSASRLAKWRVIEGHQYKYNIAHLQRDNFSQSYIPYPLILTSNGGHPGTPFRLGEVVHLLITCLNGEKARDQFYLQCFPGMYTMNFCDQQ